MEPRGFEPLTSWMQTSPSLVYDGRWGRSLCGDSLSEALVDGSVAVLICCTTFASLLTRTIPLAGPHFDSSTLLIGLCGRWRRRFTWDLIREHDDWYPFQLALSIVS